MQGVKRLVLAAAVVLGPASAFAQEGQIAGTVRDESGGVIPGVLVEVTSPALIEKVRSATTDANGQYRLTNLPVGTYSVTFSLEGFSRVQRGDVVLTSGFTAPVNATMTVGQLADTITVTAEAPTVDVQNARQVTSIAGDEIQQLPTDRNVSSLLRLTPGLTTAYQPGSQTGICSGGVGVFCNPGVAGFNVGSSGDNNLNQGRILVDGQVINSGVQGLIGGMSGGYMADIANAQEVNIQVSGALGESETGGASINIVPRTGGNTFAGNISATYTEDRFFSDNTGGFNDIGPELGADQIIHDHDISGAFGGPIKRDMLWFYAVVRDQQGEKRPVGYPNFWPNLHEGKWGFNYQPDRSKPSVTYTNKWRNGNARITYQMTQRNKFNFFWDEQDFCQDPCDGVVSVFTSPESWWSVQRRPNRLMQASWTNPYTNRLLFEAGLSATQQLYDTSEHRQFRNPEGIPRIVETGDTSGGDDISPRVNEFAGEGFFALTSGSLNSAIAGGGAEQRWLDNYQLRASASYVTGAHNAKIGYQGAIYTQETLNQANDPRLTYGYNWPNASCLSGALGACGNTSLQFPNDPFNLARRPIPNTVTINTGEGSLHEKVWYAAFYAQDQWTLGRLTVNGAVRYDHAASNYGETCVGPDLFVPVQSNGQNFYCTPPTDGVSYNDITPRWGAAWDVFGTGRTSLKWNMGRYNNAASLNGVYAGANPARRTINSLQRAWSDTDGDRIVDCDLTNFSSNGECGGPSFGQDPVRYGRDPLGLDEAGNPVGLATTQCGRREEGIPEAVQDYCAAYGESLIEGWGKRQGEWQFGLGVQHEVLPRLSAELTYNRRTYMNLTRNDSVGTGCDRFLGRQTLEECQQAYLNYRANSHDLFQVMAPVDPRLPGGGGYLVLGNSTPKVFSPTNPTAITIWDAEEYTWHGFDTNFVWRAPGGLRINGGTSTGRSMQDDTCDLMLDSPDIKHRAGNPIGAGGCIDAEPWRTRVNGSAAYVVPWVDVLVSTVFQSWPGVERSATLEYTKEQVTWMPGSESRRLGPCFAPATGTGCFGSFPSADDVTVNLLDNNELWGERITMFDVKVAKNIRFGNQRATIGVDVYNVFNSDAIQDYTDSWTLDDPTTAEVERNEWGEPAGLVSPRFVRLSLQFYF